MALDDREFTLVRYAVIPCLLHGLYHPLLPSGASLLLLFPL